MEPPRRGSSHCQFLAPVPSLLPLTCAPSSRFLIGSTCISMPEDLLLLLELTLLLAWQARSTRELILPRSRAQPMACVNWCLNAFLCGVTLRHILYARCRVFSAAVTNKHPCGRCLNNVLLVPTGVPFTSPLPKNGLS